MEMLQAMKQKPTPAAVVVKSSPQDSPSGPAAGKPLHSPPCPSTSPPLPLISCTRLGTTVPTPLLLCPKSHRCCWTQISPWALSPPCLMFRSHWSRAEWSL